MEGNQKQADQLTSWFSEIANTCKQKTKITTDISMMRMWQLGNMDIVDLENSGNPIFVLTKTGNEKINATPKERWFQVLLWDKSPELV